MGIVLCSPSTFIPLPSLMHQDFEIIFSMIIIIIKRILAFHFPFAIIYLQSLLVFGATHTMVWYDSAKAATIVRVWWRCTAMDSGALCVMMVSVATMLTQCASSWDTQEL